jgi:hypothetical protein
MVLGRVIFFFFVFFFCRAHMGRCHAGGAGAGLLPAGASNQSLRLRCGLRSSAAFLTPFRHSSPLPGRGSTVRSVELTPDVIYNSFGML